MDQTVTVPGQATNNGVFQVTVNCPTGTTVVGGGGTFPPNTPLVGPNTSLFESGPQGNGWHVRFDNDTANEQQAAVSALCLKKKLQVK